jgi:4-hydroxy-2-oxoglutarate aldolase
MSPSSDSKAIKTCDETKKLVNGIYVPVLTFFNKDDSLDLDTFKKHISWLASAGVNGIVVLGSTGEAVALTDDEKTTVSCIFRIDSNDYAN